MTTQLTVSSATRDGLTGVVTLPESLRVVGGSADVVGIDGGDGWPGAAVQAIGDGARGVLVVRPTPTEAESLQSLAAERSIPVVLASNWADNPAVVAAAPHFRKLVTADSLVDAHVSLPVGAALDQALLDLLALVRAAVGPVTDLQLVRRDRAGSDAFCRVAGEALASLGVVFSDASPSAASTRVIMPRNAVEVSLPDPMIAAPGTVVVSDPESRELLETKWETAFRASWRRLHRHVLEGAPTEDLSGFVEDVRLLRLVLV